MIIIKKINDLTRFPIIFIIFTLKNKKKYAYVLLLIKSRIPPKQQIEMLFLGNTYELSNIIIQND